LKPSQFAGRCRFRAHGFRIAALLLTLPAHAGAADLIDIYRQAKAADTTYSAARATWAAAQERIPQARAGLLPLASVSAVTQYTDRSVRFRDETIPRANSDFSSSGVSLSVTQPIYRRQNSIVYDQALTQVEQADTQLALAAQDLILRTAQAYFDVLLAQDNVALADAQKTAIGQQLEQAKRNFEVGTAPITDTDEAQARYDLTNAQLIAAMNELELRRRALEQVIARTAPPLAPLGARLVLRPPSPATMDAWVQLAQRGNLQVRIAQSAVTFSAQEITRNRAAHFPTFDAFVTFATNGAGSSTPGGIGTDTRSAVAGVQLALPIYQGGAINSRVREAIGNETRARDELEGTRRSAEFSARQAYLGITSGIAQVQALQAALVSTQSQLASTRLGQEVGVRTQVDVLNAQQLLFSAQRDLAQSKYNYVLSLLRLEAAVGELTEDDLSAVNPWLDRDASAFSVPVSVPLVSSAPVVPQRPAPAAAIEKNTADVVATIENWARAWSANDVAAYLGHYAPGFEPALGQSRSAWEAERKARIQKPRKISVGVSSPTVRFDAPDRAVVTLQQDYRSGALNTVSEKTVVMTKNGERWLIQQERVERETKR
jgi:outer membrane protein